MDEKLKKELQKASNCLRIYRIVFDHETKKVVLEFNLGSEDAQGYFVPGEIITITKRLNDFEPCLNEIFAGSSWIAPQADFAKGIRAMGIKEIARLFSENEEDL